MSKPPSSHAYANEDSLHALVDGQNLPAQKQPQSGKAVFTDPRDQEVIAQWREQRELIRTLHSEVLSESVPPHFEDVVNAVTQSQRRHNQWLRLGGIAASVLVSFVAGWTVHGQWNASDSHVAKFGPPRMTEFIKQAGYAHAVYLPESRHPVEVNAQDQAHLVQWLSKRLGKPLKIPQLDSIGYQLLGGRLLPGDQGARAQLMFQNAQGERITVYVGGVGSASEHTKETAFKLSSDGPVPTFYWVDDGFGYAISGRITQQELLNVATVIYKQL